MPRAVPRRSCWPWRACCRITIDCQHCRAARRGRGAAGAGVAGGGRTCPPMCRARLRWRHRRRCSLPAQHSLSAAQAVEVLNATADDADATPIVAATSTPCGRGLPPQSAPAAPPPDVAVPDRLARRSDGSPLRGARRVSRVCPADPIAAADNPDDKDVGDARFATRRSSCWPPWRPRRCRRPPPGWCSASRRRPATRNA